MMRHYCSYPLIAILVFLVGCGPRITDPNGKAMPSIGSEATISPMYGREEEAWAVTDLEGLQVVLKNERTPDEVAAAVRTKGPQGLAEMAARDVAAKYERLSAQGRAFRLQAGTRVKVVGYLGFYERGRFLRPEDFKNQAYFCRVSAVSGNSANKELILATSHIK
jgi:hypothetical protein